MLATNAFKIYNSQKNEEEFVGNPNGKPYIVRASKSNWIPINLLIFAEDEKDALERVRKGFRAIKERSDWEYTMSRIDALMELIENDKYIEVEAFDMKYSCQINWDSRGIV